jgi:hypothetical protein
MAISPETKGCGTGDLQACTCSLGMAAPRRHKIVGKPTAASFTGMTHVSRVWRTCRWLLHVALRFYTRVNTTPASPKTTRARRAVARSSYQAEYAEQARKLCLLMDADDKDWAANGTEWQPLRATTRLLPAHPPMGGDALEKQEDCGRANPSRFARSHRVSAGVLGWAVPSR